MKTPDVLSFYSASGDLLNYFDSQKIIQILNECFFLQN